jgi:hypothetical protein
VATLTCGSCGFSFESSAKTATRCRRCGESVRASAKRWDLAILLGCGHIGIQRGMPYAPENANRDDGGWICGICAAPDQVVAAAAGRPSSEKTPDVLLAHMVEAHASFVWGRSPPRILNSVDAEVPT